MAQGDTYNFSGANITGSNLNIKATLTNVTQTVGALPNTGTEEKAKLEDLIKQLGEALKEAPEQEAARITKMLDRAMDDAKSGDKSMLEVSAEGLKKAAEAVFGITLTVTDIVKQILALLNK